MTDARYLTTALRGRWHDRYGLAFCPAHHNTSTPALSLGNGNGGRLLAHCFAGCDFAAIIKALRGLGLVERDSNTCASQSMVERDGRLAKDRVQANKRAEQAHALSGKTRSVMGTAAETYLRRARGISCQLPATLRFSPSCWHASGQHFPAMVAIVEGSGSTAVHRTYLRADGSGKANAEPARMMLGPCAGGAVRLSAANGPLVVCEGIETGLSLLSGIFGGPATVWAALSTSGMNSLWLPPRSGMLTVAADGDSPGREAAHSLATRADALGWRVSILSAPEGRDWNDVLLGRAVA